jgi:lipopolysaccharide/colanic/teichoic acid biosynthesis glycosyltransferase
MRYPVASYSVFNISNPEGLGNLEWMSAQGQRSMIVNYCRVNNIRFINKFFESVNKKLRNGDLFVCCLESSGGRKQRLLAKYPPLLNRLYYTGDFVFKRVFPKLPITKSIYFKMTEGRNRVMSAIENHGRLYSCGFEVVETELIGNITYVLARKVGEPEYNDHASYGALISLNRIGKKGKKFKVYKFRTMHPFSEYLQKYINEQNGLQEGGKFKNDPRVTTLGRFFRKYWLDELPMIWNLLKGDIKLIGVRPLSAHYLGLYPEEFRSRRKDYKPGLLPPFYADMPKNLEEIVDSERRYFDLYDRKGIWADVVYLFKILNNILFHKARSK